MIDCKANIPNHSPYIPLLSSRSARRNIDVSQSIICKFIHVTTNVYLNENLNYETLE